GERAGEAFVDEDGDRARAGGRVGRDDVLYARVGADVAERGRAPLELGDRAEAGLRERVGEPHARENSTSSSSRSTARPESTASRASSSPSRRLAACPAAATPPAALSRTAERWPSEPPPETTSRSAAAFAAGSPPRSSAGSQRSIPSSRGSSSYSRTRPSSTSQTRFGPQGESSSMPPAPCTTYARVAPSRTSAAASVRVSSGEYVPRTSARAPAGFVSGPSTLNTVRVASSRRTGAA